MQQFDRFPRLADPLLPPLPQVSEDQLNRAVMAIVTVQGAASSVPGSNSKEQAIKSESKGIRGLAECFLQLRKLALNPQVENAEEVFDAADSAFERCIGSFNRERELLGDKVIDPLSLARSALSEALEVLTDDLKANVSVHLEKAAGFFIEAQEALLRRPEELKGASRAA